MVIVFEPIKVTHVSERTGYARIHHYFNPDECEHCRKMMRIIADEWEVMGDEQAKAHGLA